jgi:hypothetical protein
VPHRPRQRAPGGAGVREPGAAGLLPRRVRASLPPQAEPPSRMERRRPLPSLPGARLHLAPSSHAASAGSITTSSKRRLHHRKRQAQASCVPRLGSRSPPRRLRPSPCQILSLSGKLRGCPAAPQRPAVARSSAGPRSARAAGARRSGGVAPIVACALWPRVGAGLERRQGEGDAARSARQGRGARRDAPSDGAHMLPQGRACRRRSGVRHRGAPWPPGP